MTSVRAKFTAARFWWEEHTDLMRSAPGELILAVGISLWAVLLWWPVESFGEGSAFRALDDAVGGDLVLAGWCTLLAACTWLALLFDRWPPRWRCWVHFAGMLWWTFVTIDAAITRLQSPAWATTVMPTMLSYYVWKRLRRERVRVTYAADNDG